jgi:hypothetical protein
VIKLNKRGSVNFMSFVEKIQIKRGNAINLPTLEAGEPAFVLDEKELFIGSSGGNVKIGSEKATQHILDYTRNPAFGVTGGTSTAYTLSVDPSPSSIVNGNMVIIRPHVNCGISPTITINVLTAISLRNGDTTTLEADALKTGYIYAFRFDGTNFLLEYSNDMSQYEPVGSGIIISSTEPDNPTDGMVWIKKST